MHFIYKIMRFIDVFFGQLKKTFYFRTVKHKQKLKY